jgi:hypothetical protein
MWVKSNKSIVPAIALIVAILVTTIGVGVSCNTRVIEGPQGPAGVGIADIKDNGDGTWTFVFTDASGFTTPNMTGAQGPAGLTYNPMQVALLRWYEANQCGIHFFTGGIPHSFGTTGGVCFDGTNIWVANSQNYTVGKLRASDGNLVGVYGVGRQPEGICFDGANIWVANWGGDCVTKLNASGGGYIGTYAVGSDIDPLPPLGGTYYHYCPYGICFDGANIWVTNSGNNTVSKLRASDGSLVGNYDVGESPSGICFDGANIWVANPGSATVSKLRASDGSLVGTYGANGARGICFDGANIWVTNWGGDTVTRLEASDGSYVTTYGVGQQPAGICFDGANIWVINQMSNSVTKLRVSDGFVSLAGNYYVASYPTGICFDGANVWVANDGGVGKL